MYSATHCVVPAQIFSASSTAGMYQPEPLLRHVVGKAPEEACVVFILPLLVLTATAIPEFPNAPVVVVLLTHASTQWVPLYPKSVIFEWVKDAKRKVGS